MTDANQHSDFVRLLNVQEKCEEIGVSRETLRRWRLDGTGPKYVRHGNKVRYWPEQRPTGEAAS